MKFLDQDRITISRGVYFPKLLSTFCEKVNMNQRRFIKQLQRDNIDMNLFRSELNRLQGSKYQNK